MLQKFHETNQVFIKITEVIFAAKFFIGFEKYYYYEVLRNFWDKYIYLSKNATILMVIYRQRYIEQMGGIHIIIQSRTETSK